MQRSATIACPIKQHMPNTKTAAGLPAYIDRYRAERAAIRTNRNASERPLTYRRRQAGDHLQKRPRVRPTDRLGRRPCGAMTYRPWHHPACNDSRPNPWESGTFFGNERVSAQKSVEKQRIAPGPAGPPWGRRDQPRFVLSFGGAAKTRRIAAARGWAHDRSFALIPVGARCSLLGFRWRFVLAHLQLFSFGLLSQSDARRSSWASHASPRRHQ